MELELGLALAPPNHARPAPSSTPGELDLLESGASEPGSCGKRGSAEAFGTKVTLPLFVREDGNGRGDDGAAAGDWEMSSKRKKLVGWPPVKCAHRRSGGHVKVKMEGVAIGRKVNLSLHSSYEDLLDTLHSMFPSTTQDAREELDQDDHHHRRRRYPYTVAYEDGDGDWTLIGDVPWEAFVKSAKRLRILV